MNHSFFSSYPLLGYEPKPIIISRRRESVSSAEDMQAIGFAEALQNVLRQAEKNPQQDTFTPSINCIRPIELTNCLLEDLPELADDKAQAPELSKETMLNARHGSLNAPLKRIRLGALDTLCFSDEENTKQELVKTPPQSKCKAGRRDSRMGFPVEFSYKSKTELERERKNRLAQNYGFDNYTEYEKDRLAKKAKMLGVGQTAADYRRYLKQLKT